MADTKDEKVETEIAAETEMVEGGSAKNRSSDESADRLERLKQLKARASESLHANRKEVYEEEKRRQIDEKERARLERKRDQAEFELAKLESKESGKDFERQRAWDWTVEEATRWDEREKQKREAVEKSSFSDYATSAHRAYEKDMKNFKVDMQEYQRKKQESQKSEPDEDDLGFMAQRPSKQAVARLVDSLKKGDEQRLKRRRKNDDEHVTYINEKNKQFNQKIARHYDKYTKEVRDNFERGTAL